MNSFTIQNVGVQHGLGNATLAGQDVWVDDGVITNIVDTKTRESSEILDRNIIDGSGKTLMPGLIFAHTHIAYDNVTQAREVLFKHPLTRLTFIAAKVAKRAAQLGYTTMIGAGSISRIDIFLREAIEEGLFDGPQIIPCSRDILTAGPLGRRNKEKVAHIPPDYMSVLTESEEVGEATHKEIDDGAEILKIFATGDDQFPNANSCEELLTYEEIEEIIQIAHSRNTMVRCHARGLGGIRNAINAGVDIIDHASYADQQCLDLIREKNISIVPSFYQPKRYLSEGHKYGKHPEESNFALEVENVAKILPIAESMGINIAVGDDFGFAWTPHGSYHQELISYQTDLGISPQTIIKWATLNGAKMIGQEHRIGQLGKGKQADMILLSADPAQNIEVLTDQIEQVFISGKAVSV